MNAMAPLPIEAIETSQDRTVLAQRIATLLREREANQKALRAAAARFNPPPKPDELTVIHRGLLGEVEIDVDPDWIREQLAHVSPRSRRGRRLRQVLRLADDHYIRVWSDRETYGFAAAWDQSQRLEDALRDVGKAALAWPRPDAAGVALQAAALLAAELAGRADEFARHALRIVPALLDVAANAAEGRD